MTTITVTAAAGGTLDLHDVGSVHTLSFALPAVTATITYPGVRTLGKLVLAGALSTVQTDLDAEDFTAWVNIISSGNVVAHNIDLEVDGVTLNADHGWYDGAVTMADGAIQLTFNFLKSSITFS